jgi:AraC family transcriptional regulator, transcriptional activator of pobA
MKSEQLPVYSVQSFSSPERNSQPFQVEVFDANRHFQVKYPHRHDFFEVLFLTQGSGLHIIDSNKYPIYPPCVFFTSPGQAHKLELSKDIEGYIFIFTPEFYLLNKANPNALIEFPFFFTIHQDNPPLMFFDFEDVFFLETIFIRCLTEMKREEGYSVEMLRSLLDVILNQCATMYPSEGDAAAKGKGHLLVKRFYQLIEEYFQKNLTVNEYASMLAVSANHLTQTVKNLTGKTSTDIIKAKQLLEIKRLLVHTNLGMTEIANKMGFVDQSYFSRFFKRETGRTPLVYRAEHMK